MKIDTCGCCEGIEQSTPMDTVNRPGLDALSYRIGVHGSFLESMKARLTTMCINEDGECDDENGKYPLQQLTTRDSDDPAIALLDAWATVGDVLTFYQERIANEGYLRTAVQRRSILELANLVGYRLRPGVAASVYLAFLLESSYEGETEIPAGTRAQSIPGPGELPQSFETSAPLPARAAWNQIKPRLNKPQELFSGLVTNIPIYFKGVDLNLAIDDPILIDFGDTQEIYRILDVSTDPAADLTKVILRYWNPQPEIAEPDNGEPEPAAVGTPVPELLRASSLRAFASVLGESVEQPSPRLQELGWQFADALLATFAVIADMSPSPARDNAIAEDIAALQDIKKLLEKFVGTLPGNSILIEFLQRLHTWTTDSLTILEAEAAPADSVQPTTLGNLVSILSQTPSESTLPPASAQSLKRNLKISYGPASDLQIAAITNLLPHSLSKKDIYQALETAKVTADSTIKLYVLRTEATPFGHNAQLRPTAFSDGIYTYDEWEIDNPYNNGGSTTTPPPAPGPMAAAPADTVRHHEPQTLYLDAEYKMDNGGWAIIDVPTQPEPIVTNLSSSDVANNSLAAYGLSGKTTALTLNAESEWFEDAADEPFSTVRNTRIFLESEELALAQAPVDAPVPESNEMKNQIIVNGLYDSLESGRWMILSGERNDVEGVTGLRASELVMLMSAEQIFNETLPGDTYHTRLIFANDLAYSYKRETVTIYGNVAHATHGESRQEVLGSGDSSKMWQQFQLSQPPLTYLAAPTPAGAASTLKVRVNDILWPEVESLVFLNPDERGYITETDNEDKTSVIFGNGARGARLPTGSENVSAEYRVGIGKPGNAAAEQIKLLSTRPLGVKSVINPLPATGGANRESRDQARRNAPLAVLALDRLVSVQDYADFARTFAGIGKAVSKSMNDGHQEIVHLTIAGADDIPIAKSSDLYRNLTQALRNAGDPHQPFQVEIRKLMLLVVIANVRIHPDYLWEKVYNALQTALCDAFSFENRDLGQDVLLSEVIAVMQQVPGVVYVDVDVLETISETEAKNLESDEEDAETLAAKFELLAAGGTGVNQRISVGLATFADDGSIKPAQLAFLSADVPETLILKEIR